MIIRNLLKKTALFLVFVLFASLSVQAQSANPDGGNTQDPADVQAAKQAGIDQNIAPVLELGGAVSTNNGGQNTNNGSTATNLNAAQKSDLQATIDNFEKMLLDPNLSQEMRTAVENKLTIYKALLQGQ